MSEGRAMPWDEAMYVATEFSMAILPFCERIGVAGSLRRKKPEVHDLELVVVPKIEGQRTLLDPDDPDLNVPVSGSNKLHTALISMLGAGVINTDRPRKDNKKNPFGPKYYRINYIRHEQQMPGPDGIVPAVLVKKEYPIDLFAVIPPAQWGVIFLIRTGSAEFSHWFVQQGYSRGIRVVDGHLEMQNMVLDTPEEEDVFRYMGVPYREPEDREVK